MLGETLLFPRAVAAETRDIAMARRERHGGVAERRPAREARRDPGDLEWARSELAARRAREARVRTRPRSLASLQDALRLHAERGHRLGQRIGDEIHECARTERVRPRKAGRERERELAVVEHRVTAGRAPHDVEPGRAD